VTLRVPATLPRYRRELPYGWVLGAFQVEELLRHAPERALEVRFHGALPDDRRERLRIACARAGVAIRRDDATVAAKRSKGTARALGVFAKVDAELRPDRPHLALVAPRDPGNLGATLRTALAFGVEDVAVIGDGSGVDPWSPHVLRASLGAAFALRVRRTPSLAAYQSAWPDRPLWLLDARGETDVDELARGPWPATLAAGPEWPGLSDEERTLGRGVRIDHDPRVESLNVTVAVGIALRALLRAARGG
jgi:TrmH family RNA methyltransferase